MDLYSHVSVLNRVTENPERVKAVKNNVLPAEKYKDPHLTFPKGGPEKRPSSDHQNYSA
jgi:hypothetical protein